MTTSKAEAIIDRHDMRLSQLWLGNPHMHRPLSSAKTTRNGCQAKKKASLRVMLSARLSVANEPLHDILEMHMHRAFFGPDKSVEDIGDCGVTKDRPST